MQQPMGALAASQSSVGGAVPAVGAQTNLLQQKLLSVLSQKTGSGAAGSGSQDLSKTIQQLLQTQAALKAQQGQAQPAGMAKPAATQPGAQQQGGYQGFAYSGQTGYRPPAPPTGSNVGGSGRMFQ